jgi:hypothetical protein
MISRASDPRAPIYFPGIFLSFSRLLKICLLLLRFPKREGVFLKIFSRSFPQDLPPFVYCFCFRFPHDLPQDLPTVAVSDLAEHWLRKHLERKGTMQLHLS